MNFELKGKDVCSIMRRVGMNRGRQMLSECMGVIFSNSLRFHCVEGNCTKNRDISWFITVGVSEDVGSFV